MKKKMFLILSIGMIASLPLSSCKADKTEKNSYDLINKDINFEQNSAVMARTINDGSIYSLSYTANDNADMISFDKDNISGTGEKISEENVSNLFYTESYNIIYSVSGDENAVYVNDLSDKLLFTVSLDNGELLNDVCENEKNICFLCNNDTVIKYSDTGEHLNEFNFDLDRNNSSMTLISGIAERDDRIYCLAVKYGLNDNSSENLLMEYSEEKCEFEADTELYDIGDSADKIFFDSSENLVISGYDDSYAYIDICDTKNNSNISKKEIEGIKHIYGEQSGSLIYEKDGKIYIFDTDKDDTKEIYDIGDKTLINAAVSENNVRLSLRESIYLLELTSQDIEGKNISSEFINVPEKYVNCLIRDIYVFENGNVGFVAVDYNDGIVYICVYNSDKETEWYELSDFDLQDETNISLININEEFAVVKNMDDLYSYSFKDGKTKSVSAQDSEQIISCCVSSGNKLNLLYNKNEALYLSEFNTERGINESEKKIHVGNGVLGDSIINGNGEYDIFLNIGDQLIGVKDNDKQDILVNWNDVGYKKTIDLLNILDDGKFLCVSEDGRFSVLEKAEAGHQEVVHVGILGGVAPDYFNYAKSISDSGFIVDFKDYSEYAKNGDAGIGQFNIDIVSGDIPDVIVFRGATDIDLYREKNLLEPLDSFIDFDTEIKREDYLSNVFDINTIDGKLYYITPQVMVRTILGKSDNSENTLKGLTENIEKYKNEYPFGETSCTSILNYLLSVYSFDLTEDNECIREYLEFSKKYGVNNTKNVLSMKDYYDGINDGKIQFMISSLSGFENYNIVNKMLFGGDIRFCGVSENKQDNIAFEEIYSMAITTRSACKNSAWKFIKSFLSDDYQNGISDSYGFGFPVKLSAIDHAAKKAQDKELAVSAYPMGDEEINVGYISDDEVEKVIDIIKSCNTKCSQDPKIISILNEEATSYFGNESDIDSTISSIKNKVSLYINETK